MNGRVTGIIIVIIWMVCLLDVRAFGQKGPVEDSTWQRIGISAGLGVNYHDARDIVERINGNSINTQRVDDFKSGVEFFGAVSVPLSPDWVVKAEYVYMLSSYTLSTGFGNAEFSYVVHMPTIIGQYVLFQATTYNVKVGVGAGYHVGSYTEKYSSVDKTYSGKGPGTLIELEANTGLGEHLYANLGTQMRFEFVGDLTDGAGGSPTGTSTPTTLHFFSVGARLGMSYYF